MICTHVASARVKPGRMDDVLRLTEQVRPMLERAGGQNVRLYRVSVGGSATGLIYWAVDNPDIAAWGRALDALNADDDWGRLLEQVWGPDGAVTLEQALLLQEDGRYGATNRPSAPGVVVDLSYWDLVPGRLADARAASASMGERASAFGGHVRVFRQYLAGDLTGVYVVANEFPNIAAFGEWRHAQSTDPATRASIADFLADPPAIRRAAVISVRIA